MPNLRQDKLDFRQNHAIVIGIDHYPLIQNPLTSAVNDASRIAQLLKNNQGFDNVLVLLEANRPDLVALITWLGSKDKEDLSPLSLASFSSPEASGEAGFASKSVMGWYEGAQWERESGEALPLVDFTEKDWNIDPDKDSILFYYAGHGIKGDPDNGPAGYIVPADAAGGIGDYRNLIPMDDLYWSLKTLGCLHTLLILDCCFAGKFRFSSSTRFMAGTEVPHLYKERFLQYTRSRAWQVLASSGPDQEANDSFSLLGVRSDNSPFAASLIEALQGEADLQQEGVITAVELYLSVRQKVKKLQEEQKGGGKPQHPGLFPMEDHRGGEFIFLNPHFDFDSLKPRPLQNPYKGLLPYEPEDHEWFFGREKELQEAVSRIEGLPFLIISGDSAVGKSSFAKAGLFAFLKKELDFELLLMRPGSKPWSGQSVIAKRKMQDGTEQEVKYFTGLEELCKSVSGEGGDLLAGFDQENTKNRMVLIDQYEEIFTEHADKEEILRFEEGMQKLIEIAEKKPEKKDTGTTRVVITLRSDFEWQLENSAFGKFLLSEPKDLHHNLVRLFPMGLEELQEALTGPASKEIFEFEEGLVEQILEDINYAPAALPLLSFTMKKLYEMTMEKGEKDGNGDPKRFFTKHLYAHPEEGIGSVIGALRTSANELYLSFGKKVEGEVDEIIETPLQETMKKIILRLIRPGEGQATRRRVYQSTGTLEDFWSELDYPLDEEDQMVEKVLDKLEETQLIVRGKDLGNGQNYVELAHDALVNYWPRCLGWVKDFGQDRLVLLRQLWEAALENKKKSLPAASRELDPYKKEKLVAASNRSAVIQTSSLWDNSPKLMEVIHLLWDPDCTLSQGENKDILEVTAHFLESELKEEERASTKAFLTKWIADHQIITGKSFEKLEALDFKDPAAVLQLVLFEGRHWLNQLEVEFIWESWNKRRSRINSLIRERDEARANLYSMYAVQQKQQGNFELGMRLAMKALQGAPERMSEVIYHGFCLDTFKRPPSFFIVSFDLAYQDYAISPDGTKILLYKSIYKSGRTSFLADDEDHFLYLYDIKGKLISKFGGQRDLMVRVAFSHDGERVLAKSKNGLLEIWDWNNNSNITISRESRSKITSECFSPVDNQALLLNFEDGSIVLKDLKRKNTIQLGGPKDGHRIAKFLPNGDKVLTYTSNVQSNEKTILYAGKLYNLNGELLGEVRFHSQFNITVHFPPQKNQILFNLGRKELYLWDFKSNELRTIEPQVGNIWSVKFAPKGDKILFYVGDYTGGNLFLQSWSAENSTLKGSSKRLPGEIIGSVFFIHHGERIVGKNKSGRMLLWDLDGNQLFDFGDYQPFSFNGVFNVIKENKFLLSPILGKSSLQIWDWITLPCFHLSEVGSSFEIVHFSPSGQYLVGILKNGKMLIWDWQDHRVTTPEDENLIVKTAQFSPDSLYLVVCKSDETIEILDLEGKHVIGLNEKFSRLSTAQFSPDGEQVLISAAPKSDSPNKRKLVLWNWKENSVKDLSSKVKTSHSVEFSPNGNQILIQGYPMPLVKTTYWQLLDLEKDQLVSFPPDLDLANSISYSPDGSHLLICSALKPNIYLWEIGAVEATPLNHSEGGGFARFFLHEQQIITCNSDQTVTVRDHKGNILTTLDKFSQKVDSACLSLDGQFVLIGTKETSLSELSSSSTKPPTQLWDIQGNLVADLGHFEEACFSPDGRHILTITADSVKLWPMPDTIQKWINDFENIPFTYEEKVKFGIK